MLTIFMITLVYFIIPSWGHVRDYTIPSWGHVRDYTIPSWGRRGITSLQQSAFSSAKTRNSAFNHWSSE